MLSENQLFEGWNEISKEGVIARKGPGEEFWYQGDGSNGQHIFLKPVKLYPLRHIAL